MCVFAVFDYFEFNNCGNRFFETKHGVLKSNEIFSNIFSAEVKMPSGKRDLPTVQDNHDGTVSLKYDPKEEGLHELFVKYNGENLQGKYWLIFKICSSKQF